MSALERLLSEQGIAHDSLMIARLERYTTLLLQWNRTHNLTGAKTPEAVNENLLDSLYPLRFLPRCESVIDIGSGAGFPALVLGVALLDSSIHLVEPRQKRAAFLHYAALELELPNITVHNARIEALELPQPALLTSRAVTSAPALLELARHLIAPHTSILLYKGERVEEEIPEAGYTITRFKERRYLFKQGV